ncbi:TPA: restriction endonuclease subunit S, partial [Streptococcus suis]
ALHQRKLDKLKSVKQAYLSEMFPAEGERVPKRRFPGFTDDWELRKLGEIADVFDGTHQTPKYTNHGVMFLSVEDIATLKSEKYISLEDFEKEFKIFPEFNDVLMTRIGDIGTSNIVKTNDKIAYYVSLALIKPRKLESHFLNSIIQSKDFQNELWKRTLHIAFPKKINKGEISEVNLKFPSLPEQEAIGTFFSTLDRHITLHQRKLEKLKNLKKALLNELFV